MKEQLIAKYYKELVAMKDSGKLESIIKDNYVETRYKNYCAEFIAYSRISGLQTARKIFTPEVNDEKNMRNHIRILMENLIQPDNTNKESVYKEQNRQNIEACLTAISLYLRTYPTKEENEKL